MKTTLMKVLVIGLVLVSPVLVQAQSTGLTTSQVAAIISLLQSFGADQSVINNVQISLNGGTPSIGTSTSPSTIIPPPPFCYNFNSDLTIGSTGADVAALNKALFNSLGTSVSGTTNFTESTLAVVVLFQKKYGIPQTGYVGPITRARLNSLYGCATPPGSGVESQTSMFPFFSASPTTGPAPLNVNFVAGVDSSSLSSYSVDFGDGQSSALQNNCPGGSILACGQPSAQHTYSSPGTYVATLIQQPPFVCNAPAGAYCVQVMPTPVVMGSVTIVVGAPETVPKPQIVTFSASPTTGPAPLEVNFTFPSKGSESYTIDFGNGQTGGPLVGPTCSPDGGCLSTRIAFHTYTSPGTYVATLIQQPPFVCNAPAGAYCVQVMPAPVVMGSVTIVVGGTTTAFPTISTAALPSATIGVDYSKTGASISSSGGTGTIGWTVTSGTLPPGIYLNKANCITSPCSQPATIGLFGTPTAVGTYTFTMTVTVGTQTASKQLTIVVNKQIDSIVGSEAPISTGDSGWKQTRSPASGWQNVSFDDSTWQATVDEGVYGGAPWYTTAKFPSGTLARWIWYYDSRNSSDTSTVYFRKTFVPTYSSATLTITADNSFTAYVNGIQVASGTDWTKSQTATISLNPNATNAVAIKATNSGLSGGVIAEIRPNTSISTLSSNQLAGAAGALGSTPLQSQSPTPSTSTATPFSYTFTLDLYRGQSNAEVSALQQALKLQNLFTGDITGNFYDQTREAVMAFQLRYGISATGYVGQLTRTKLNELYSR